MQEAGRYCDYCKDKVLARRKQMSLGTLAGVLLMCLALTLAIHSFADWRVAVVVIPLVLFLFPTKGKWLCTRCGSVCKAASG